MLSKIVKHITEAVVVGAILGGVWLNYTSNQELRHNIEIASRENQQLTDDIHRVRKAVLALVNQEKDPEKRKEMLIDLVQAHDGEYAAEKVARVYWLLGRDESIKAVKSLDFLDMMVPSEFTRMALFDVRNRLFTLAQDETQAERSRKRAQRALYLLEQKQFDFKGLMIPRKDLIW